MPDDQPPAPAGSPRTNSDRPDPARIPSALVEHLNPNQRTAVETLSGPLLVVAGPGSGKTRVLTTRIAALVAAGVPPWQILAVTFTNKAAAEMRERVADLVGTDAASQMWISTFHSACVRILRAHAADAGLPRAFSIIDAGDAKKLVGRVLDDMGADPADAGEWLSKLSYAKNHRRTHQVLAGSHRHEDQALAVVGAEYQARLAQMGSVDFDDLLLRAVELLERRPDIAAKYQRRFRHVLVDEYQDTNICQYQIAEAISAGSKNLCVVGDLDQCHPADTLVDTTTGPVRIAELDPATHEVLAFDGDGLVPSRFELASRPYDGDVLTVTVAGRDVTMTPDHRVIVDWAAASAMRCVTVIVKSATFAHLATVELDELVACGAQSPPRFADCDVWVVAAHLDDTETTAYQDALASCVGATRFDTLPPEAAGALIRCAGQSPLYPTWVTSPGSVARYGGIARASNLVAGLSTLPVTVDGQVRFAPVERVERRRHGGAVWSLSVPEHHNYVADGVVVRNCIYTWRGASASAVDDFVADHPGTRVVVLDQNYRSTQVILDAAQAVIDPNPATHRAKLWTANPGGAAVRVVECADDRDEATFITSEITASRAPAGQRAVLVRTNAQTRPLEEALTRARIPYEVIGALRFYDRAEIRDALAYLRCAVNPADALSFSRCVNTPRRKIGPVAVDKILAAAAEGGVTPIDAARDASTTSSTIARFIDIYDAVVVASTQGPAAAVRAAVYDTGLRESFVAKEPERVENLDELVAAAAAFEMSPPPTHPDPSSLAGLTGWALTVAFLESVALVSAADGGDTVSERVPLLTVHAAKGKEFDEVWVAGAEEGLFPHSKVAADPAGVAEERRLLFVALSRARHRLTVTHASRRYRFGAVKDSAPSPFLDDLPPSVVRTTAPTTRPWGPRPQPRWSRTPSRPQTSTARPTTPTTAGGLSTASMRPVRPSPMASGPRLAPGSVQAGDTVTHTTFGPGTVTDIDTETITVRFGDRTRQLRLAYAPLTTTT